MCDVASPSSRRSSSTKGRPTTVTSWTTTSPWRSSTVGSTSSSPAPMTDRVDLRPAQWRAVRGIRSRVVGVRHREDARREARFRAPRRSTAPSSTRRNTPPKPAWPRGVSSQEQPPPGGSASATSPPSGSPAASSTRDPRSGTDPPASDRRPSTALRASDVVTRVASGFLPAASPLLAASGFLPAATAARSALTARSAGGGAVPPSVTCTPAVWRYLMRWLPRSGSLSRLM